MKFMVGISEFPGSDQWKLMKDLATKPHATNTVRVPGFDALQDGGGPFVREAIAKFCPDAMSPSQTAPTPAPTPSPTKAPTLHPCNDGSHGCDTSGGICYAVSAADAEIEGLIFNLDGTTYSGTGDWVDSVSSRNGELEGGVSWDAEKQAFRFSSSNADRIRVKDFQIGPSVYQELTMTAWVWMVDLSSNCWVVNQEIGGGWNRAILIDDGRCGGGKISVAKGSGCGTSNLQAEIGKWVHVAGVWRQGQDSYAYRDGVKSNQIGVPTHSNGSPDLAI